MADICQLPGESARGSALGAERRRKILLRKIFAFARGGLQNTSKKLPNGSFLKRKILFVEHESADNESDNTDEREHTEADEEIEPTCQDHARVEQRDD